MKSKLLTWDNYTSDVKKLTGKIIKSNKKYDFIFGIPRGGLILAGCLSHKLNLPILLDVNLLEKLSMDYLTNILVVDDIADSGKTIMKYANRFDTATIYRKFDCSLTPTYYVNINKRWIIFPYECPEVKDTVSKVTGDNPKR